MTTPRKGLKRTTLRIILVNQSVNLEFNVDLPSQKWWWLFVVMASIIIIWRPELTGYLKAVVTLIQP